MRPLLLITAVLAFAMACPAADDNESERKVTAAIHAADGLSAVAEYDLSHLIRDENRNFLGATTENGGTVRAGHASLKSDVERVVTEMGEIKGALAETALRVRELALVGSAEMDLVLGFDPIDEDLITRARELRDRAAQVRVKLNPVLPVGVGIQDPDPGIAF